MEIRRFGPGNRRPDGPPGTQGITGQVIWNDARANISELAFSRRALIAPHTNPNTTLFIVVSGGGFVQVGDERTRINHGEAVVWPAGVPHGAYTDGTEMRAIVIELPQGAGGAVVLDGSAVPALGGAQADRADGRLAEPERSREEHDETEGEPW
jgi:quercetin dioxygenase-like cupin family protein